MNINNYKRTHPLSQLDNSTITTTLLQARLHPYPEQYILANPQSTISHIARMQSLLQEYDRENCFLNKQVIQLLNRKKQFDSKIGVIQARDLEQEMRNIQEEEELKLRELRALKLMNVDASYGNMYANNVGLSVDRNKIIDKYYRHSDSKAKLKNIDNTHSISNIGTANKGNTNNTATKNMVSHEKNKRSTHVKRYEYVDADKDSNQRDSPLYKRQFKNIYKVPTIKGGYEYSSEQLPSQSQLTRNISKNDLGNKNMGANNVNTSSTNNLRVGQTSKAKGSLTRDRSVERYNYSGYLSNNNQLKRNTSKDRLIDRDRQIQRMLVRQQSRSKQMIKQLQRERQLEGQRKRQRQISQEKLKQQYKRKFNQIYSRNDSKSKFNTTNSNDNTRINTHGYAKVDYKIRHNQINLNKSKQKQPKKFQTYRQPQSTPQRTYNYTTQTVNSNITNTNTNTNTNRNYSSKNEDVGKHKVDYETIRKNNNSGSERRYLDQKSIQTSDIKSYQKQSNKLNSNLSQGEKHKSLIAPKAKQPIISQQQPTSRFINEEQPKQDTKAKTQQKQKHQPHLQLQPIVQYQYSPVPRQKQDYLVPLIKRQPYINMQQSHDQIRVSSPESSLNASPNPHGRSSKSKSISKQKTLKKSGISVVSRESLKQQSQQKDIKYIEASSDIRKQQGHNKPEPNWIPQLNYPNNTDIRQSPIIILNQRQTEQNSPTQKLERIQSLNSNSNSPTITRLDKRQSVGSLARRQSIGSLARRDSVGSPKKGISLVNSSSKANADNKIEIGSAVKMNEQMRNSNIIRPLPIIYQPELNKSRSSNLGPYNGPAMNTSTYPVMNTKVQWPQTDIVLEPIHHVHPNFYYQSNNQLLRTSGAVAVPIAPTIQPSQNIIVSNTSKNMINQSQTEKQNSGQKQQDKHNVKQSTTKQIVKDVPAQERKSKQNQQNQQKTKNKKTENNQTRELQNYQVHKTQLQKPLNQLSMPQPNQENQKTKSLQYKNIPKISMDRSQESVNNNSSSKPIYKSSSQHRILPSERIVYEHSQALQQPHANINKQGYMVNYMDTKQHVPVQYQQLSPQRANKNVGHQKQQDRANRKMQTQIKQQRSFESRGLNRVGSIGNITNKSKSKETKDVKKKFINIVSSAALVNKLGEYAQQKTSSKKAGGTSANRSSIIGFSTLASNTKKQNQ